MEIIKVYTFNNEKWNFEGCYILNLKYDELGTVSKYHFYTMEYFLDPSIKRMCIQPLPKLSDEHHNDSWEDIDQRILYWYKNCHQILHHDIDILGQPHGQYISDRYDEIFGNKKIGIEEESIIQKTFNDLKEKLWDINNRLKISQYLLQPKIIEILQESKRVTVEEIFSEKI